MRFYRFSIRKKLLLALLSLITNLGVNAYSQVKKNTTQPLVQQLQLHTLGDTLQYSLGSFFAQWIKTNGFQLSNATLFSKGMDDVFQNRTRLVADSEVAKLITAYQQASRKDLAEQQEKKLFDAVNNAPGVGRFPNGVYYSITKEGKGIRPSEKDSILVNLIAKLPDGTVVENTYDTKQPFATIPSAFFAGLRDALTQMPEGSQWTLYIPSRLAYGDKGTPRIPPNTALILDVELLQVKPVK